MKNTILTFFSLFCLIAITYSQDEASQPEKYDKNELGLNVTNVLISLVGNNSVDDIDPTTYAIVYKRRLVKGNFLRLAANVKLNINSNEEITNVTNNNFFNFRIGWEKRRNISSKLEYFYGFDILGSYEAAESTFATPTDIVELNEYNYGAGIGPIFGLQFHINKRMLISTEATLYGVLNVERIREKFEVNTIFNKNETNYNFSAISSIPKSLYFVMTF